MFDFCRHILLNARQYVSILSFFIIIPWQFDDRSEVKLYIRFTCQIEFFCNFLINTVIIVGLINFTMKNSLKFVVTAPMYVYTSLLYRC